MCLVHLITWMRVDEWDYMFVLLNDFSFLIQLFCIFGKICVPKEISTYDI